MKAILKFIVLSCLIVLWRCEKSRIYNGNQQIKGAVLFENALTGKQDTAKGASITLNRSYKQKKRGSFSKEDVSEEYNLVSASGTFTLNYLSSKDLSIRVTYNQLMPGSKSAITYSLEENIDDKSGTYNPVLKWNGIGCHLKITVTDSLGNPLENAQVCLYRNQKFMETNGSSCAGSAYSAITNKYGIALFANIEPAEYFFAGSLSAGSIVLTNKSPVSNKSTGAISNDKINDVAVKLFQKQN
jgi:hypothetical protein